MIVTEKSGLAELFGGGSGDASSSEASLEAKARDAARDLSPLKDLTESLPTEAVTWVESAAPMASGETTVAALPYALVLR